MMKENKYVFLLQTPHSGRSFLTSILKTSENVSTLKDAPNDEGQRMLQLEDIYTPQSQWDRTARFPWVYIEKVWKDHWDQSKPVLLETSNSHLCRADFLEKRFDPSYFIALHRNPYMVALEYFNRNPNQDLHELAKFVVQCFRWQKANCEQRKHCLKISYEKLLGNPLIEGLRLIQFLPEIETLKIGSQSIGMNQERPNTFNVNRVEDSIKLTQPFTNSHLSKLNEVFTSSQSVMAYFGYKVCGNVNNLNLK